MFYQDLILIILPLPFFIVVCIYYFYKDEIIQEDNIEVQKEIDKVKHLHDVRKKSEEYFDNV